MKIAQNSDIDKKYDTINIFNRKSSNWNSDKNAELISTSTCYNPPFTKRESLIISMKNNNKIIKIGVCHLFGGKFDEDNLKHYLHNDLTKKYTCILEKMKDVDIILGDFNVDYEYYHSIKSLGYNDMRAKQSKIPTNTQKYLLANSIPLNTFVNWNETVFRFLEQNGYENICANDDCFNNKYKIYHTTPYNTSVDVVYVKKSMGITLKKFEIIDLMKMNGDDIDKANSLSDHNGIYAELSISI
jgi:hypothetical protein